MALFLRAGGLIGAEFIFDGNESKIWSFCFNIYLERIKLCKKLILDIKEAWLRADKCDGSVLIQPNITLLSTWSVYSIASITYGINSTFLILLYTFKQLYEMFYEVSSCQRRRDHLRDRLYFPLISFSLSLRSSPSGMSQARIFASVTNMRLVKSYTHINAKTDYFCDFSLPL